MTHPTGTSTATAAEHEVMGRALALAATPGVPQGPNPRVGCVLLDAEGAVLAAGFHRGAGSPHAEVDALADLAGRGGSAVGATAVVTLEPCHHRGRTGPCTQALLDAGVTRVVHALDDPNPVASGGGAALTAAGVEVVGGVEADAARVLNRGWLLGLEQQRPFVTWKLASTLDGRSAAADGTSRWITSVASRRDTHRRRAACDVILVGTATVATDDPQLTVRDDAGANLPQQPLRAVMGRRELSPDRRVLDARAETVLLRTHDPHEALRELFDLGRRQVFLEGGPTLAAAFVHAGLVDEVVAYLAPTLLGSGLSAVGDLGVGTIADALHLHIHDVAVLGDGDQRDLRVVATVATRPLERT